MDFFTIAITLAMAVGILGADAALTANTLAVSIKVPALVAVNGIEHEFAEDVFAAEVARMVETPSLLHPPAVRSSTEPSVVTVIAKSMGLDDLTFAVQQTVGLEPVKLSGMIIPGDKPRFVMSAVSSQTGPFTVDVRSEDGDMVALVRRAAQATMERVEPYRAALFHFTEAADANSTDMSAAEAVALRELEQPVRTKMRERRALFTNLLGIIALMRNDLPAADRHFTTLVEQHPNSAIGHLNLGFLRIQQDRYDEATKTVHQIFHPRHLTKDPRLLCSAYITLGVAAWARHDLIEAEAMFRRAVKEYPGTTAGYEYWGRLLIDSGRRAEGEQKRHLGIANRPYFENYPEVAMLYFELSPRDRTPLTRTRP